MNWTRNKAQINPLETTYEVVLPQSRITLTYGVPRAESNFLSFQLQSSDGIIADSLTVEEPDWGTEEDPNDPREVDPDGNWRLLRELFSEVHRHVTGWDKVLKDVEKALQSPGVIGEIKNKAS